MRSFGESKLQIIVEASEELIAEILGGPSCSVDVADAPGASLCEFIPTAPKLPEEVGCASLSVNFTPVGSPVKRLSNVVFGKDEILVDLAGIV